MKIFFDTSAFVKRFVEETGSDTVAELCDQASALGLSIICLPEALSTLSRKVREEKLTVNHYDILKEQILEDIEDAQIINLVPDVIEDTIELLENNKLRSLDALHIACALVWRADLFVTADKRQTQAARNVGLRTRLLSEGVL